MILIYGRDLRRSCMSIFQHRYHAKISAVRSLADICFLHVLIRLIRCILVSVCSSVFKWC